MRTAIRDVAEGMDMGLETGSVPGFSCSLYGGVDFEEDYREVTGWSAVGKEAIPGDGGTLMKKGKNHSSRKCLPSDGIAYLLLHLFQLMGQDFHVAADLLVGYP